MAEDPDRPEKPESRQKLSRRQLELVLRRAAELERNEADGDELVSAEEVERLGLEAGLSPESLERALVEVRTGALVAPAAPPGLVDRALGPPRLVIERRVPGPLGPVRERVERFLRDQLMSVKRNFGDRVLWEQAQGWGSTVRRAIDWSGQYVLAQGTEIESLVTAAEEGRVLVRLTVSSVALRRTRLLGAAGGSLAGAALAAFGLAVGAGHLPLELALLAAGGGAATFSTLGARRAYRRDLARMEVAVERLLDALEHAGR